MAGKPGPGQESFPGFNLPGSETTSGEVSPENPWLPPKFRLGERPVLGDRYSYTPPLRSRGERLGDAASAFVTNASNGKPPFGNEPSTPMEHAIGAGWGTKALTGFQATKWAFRGTRTTPNPSSEAAEQNIYGGVQRDIIPTRRISTRPMGTPSQGEGYTRERLNKEAYESQVYPMMQQQQPMMQGGPPPPMAQPGLPRDPFAQVQGFSSEDPLFNQNTGSTPYNAAQFGNVHQQRTSGAPRQP